MKISVSFLSYDTNDVPYFISVPALRWRNSTDITPEACIPYRSIIVTLNNGYYQNVFWEPTTCLGSFGRYSCIDGMLNKDFSGLPATINDVKSIVIYVMFAGLDGSRIPNILTSSSDSPYRLTNMP